MKLIEQQHDFGQDVAKLLQYIASKKQFVTFGEAFRTPEQARLYAAAGKGIIGSLHCKRLAVDLNLFTAEGEYITHEEPYRCFGEYWETLSTLNRWGGNFARGDANHFEREELS